MSRFAKYSREVWGIAEKIDRIAAELGITTTEGYFGFIGMPLSLEQAIGIQPEETLQVLTGCALLTASAPLGLFSRWAEKNPSSI